MAKPKSEHEELKPAIHTRWDGLAPCGFSNLTPEHWPASQTWCNFTDTERLTCEGCKEWAEAKLAEMRKVKTRFGLGF